MLQIVLNLASQLLNPSFRVHAGDKIVVVLLVGLNMCNHCEINHYYGIIYGWTTMTLRLVQWLADCMRRTCAAYHYYSIRKVKRHEDKIINERLADSLLTNGARDFWSEIKHIRSSKTGTSCSVDGHTEASSIAKLFADIYCDLSHTMSLRCSIYKMKSIVYLQ